MRAPGRGKSALGDAGPPQGAKAPSGGSAAREAASVGVNMTADLIAEHPAMRRILDSQRAWIDGGRVLAYRTALELDLLKHHPDAARRDRANRWCSLVTPVLKAALTQQAFYGASECLQVFGGHGYVREWGVEQIVRDARVAMIYEGTNEIQAIDLLLRKVLTDGGAAMAALLQELCGTLDASPTTRGSAEAQVLRLAGELRLITTALVDAAPRSAELAYWIADDYLRMVALVLLAWAWTQIDAAARTSAAEETAGRWSAPAQAFRLWILPEFEMRLGIIRARLAGTAAPGNTTN